MAGALAAAGAALGDAVDGRGGGAGDARSSRAPSWSPKADSRSRVLRHVKDGVAKGPGLSRRPRVRRRRSARPVRGDRRSVVGARSRARSPTRSSSHFHDATDGGFFFTPDDGEAILVRPKDSFDHAVPSGAAVACPSALAPRLARRREVRGRRRPRRRAELAAAAAREPDGHERHGRARRSTRPRIGRRRPRRARAPAQRPSRSRTSRTGRICRIASSRGPIPRTRALSKRAHPSAKERPRCPRRWPTCAAGALVRCRSARPTELRQALSK